MKKLLVLFLILITFGFPMKLIKVEENLYMVRGNDGQPSKENKGFISNAFAVLTDEGWIVVDSLTTPELAKEFIKLIKKEKK